MNHDDLRAKAKAAAAQKQRWCVGRDGDEECSWVCGRMLDTTEQLAADEAFIAAFSPDVALRLLDEIERLRDALGRIYRESEDNLMAALAEDVLWGAEVHLSTATPSVDGKE